MKEESKIGVYIADLTAEEMDADVVTVEPSRHDAYDIYKGWIVCSCGQRVYVILKSGETYPCPKCTRALAFGEPKDV